MGLEKTRVSCDGRFGLYDSLPPRYQSRHTEREVRDWFANNGFVQIKKWSELGLSGERRG